MPGPRTPCRAEFRRPMVDPVRVRRDPTGLPRAFEPSAKTIRNWVAEAKTATNLMASGGWRSILVTPRRLSKNRHPPHRNAVRS